MADVTVTDHPEDSRYEARVDDALAGVAEYRLSGETITFVHTEVDDRFEGQGVGSRLARHALDDVRARGLSVVVECAFIKGWIEKHPDYHDLVASA